MGNFTSCFNSNLQSARLIHVTGTTRHIKVPITAAEIMLLEQPGHLVSPVADNLRSSFRLSALRADQVLSGGNLYFLIPVARLNSFVTESELEMLRSSCGKVNKVKRRRKSKVLPEGCSGDVLGNSDYAQRVCGSPLWRPVLEPIYE